ERNVTGVQTCALPISVLITAHDSFFHHHAGNNPDNHQNDHDTKSQASEKLKPPFHIMPGNSNPLPTSYVHIWDRWDYFRSFPSVCGYGRPQSGHLPGIRSCILF